MRKKIYIFGAGTKGIELLEQLNLLGNNIINNVVAFIDNDKNKQKTKIQDLECLSISEAIEKGAQEAIILISPVKCNEIVMELEENNFKNLFCTNSWIRHVKNYKPIILEETDYINAMPFNHYESPYPDIVEIHKREKELFDINTEIYDIDFNVSRQLELISLMKEYEVPRWEYYRNPNSQYRYFYKNNWFGGKAAEALYYMIRILNPKRIIEVGSGFSTSVMLDTNERYFDNKIEINSIEPRAERLKSLLKFTDNLTIIEKDLQDVPLNFFEVLKENDILFIDSSHVSRIGSDVNKLFFEILPRLRKGVYIHFHDITWPFVYPPKWIYEGRAYNEIYILRAFLMNNKDYSIQLFGDMLSTKYSSRLGELNGCGAGSLWIRKDN